MGLRFRVRDRVIGGRRARPTRPQAPGIDAETGAGLEQAPETGPAGGGGAPLVSGTDPAVIDTLSWDQPEKTAAYLLSGGRNLLIDTGSPRSAERMLQALAELGVTRLDYVALTHHHLDQAGGAGHLARHFPDAVFLVHPGAEALLADPDRLTASMESLGGRQAIEAFGQPEPVPESRIRTVVDGDSVDLGDRQIEVIAAPGHTTTHLAWFDREKGALFCGDALGVQVPGSGAVRPATPPTGFSYKRSLESIGRLRGTGATTVWRSHFGAADTDLESECSRAIEVLEKWHDSFLEQCGVASGEEDLNRRFNASLEATLEPVAPAVRRSMELISPAWLNLAGLRDDRDRESDARDRLTDAA